MEEERFEFTANELKKYFLSCYIEGASCGVRSIKENSNLLDSRQEIYDNSDSYTESMLSFKKENDIQALC